MVKQIDLLAALATQQPLCSIAGWRNGTAVGHGEFLARVEAWRGLLRGTPGACFALYIRDGLEFAGALLGAWQAGKIIVLPGDTLPATCNLLRRRVDGYLGEFAAAWHPLAPGVHDPNEGGRDFHSLQPDFEGLVLYTSGSTSTAQPIAKKLAQLSAEVATLERQFGGVLARADIVATVSHQHIYGLLFKILWPLAAGRAFHAQSISFLEELTGLSKERACALVSSPAHLERLVDNPAWASMADRLRAVFSSGAPLSLQTARESERLLGAVPIEVYGSSETGGIAWRQQRSHKDAVWTALPGVRWRIDQKRGVLEVCSANLPNQDWFRTADRAASAGADRFSLRGRVDRVAKIEGKRISLGAIEGRLEASPLVSRALAVVLEGRRQRVAAFVVPSRCGSEKLAATGKTGFNRMLRELLRSSVDPVGLPRVWRYLANLPMNSQGKTTHAELIALIEPSTRPLAMAGGRALGIPPEDRGVVLSERSESKDEGNGAPGLAGGLHAASSAPLIPRQRLIEKDARRAVFEMTAPRDLRYFDGHFSGMPILAGVVQVDWVIHYGRQCFELPPAFRALEGLKFRRVILPEAPFRLELVWNATKSYLSFEFTSRAGSHASGRVVFGAPDA